MLAIVPDRKLALEVREAEGLDMNAVLELRATAKRPFVGDVPVPPGLTWWVAARGERVVACVGLGMMPGRVVLFTDLYDDGTLTGKRGIVMLLHELSIARVKIYGSVPLDRPGLRKALEKRGGRLAGWSMEFGTGAPKEAEWTG